MSERFTLIPPKKELIQKLTERGVYGQFPQSDEFFDLFLEKVAGKEKVGDGLAIAWALAEHDWGQGMAPVIVNLNRAWFETVIDTITPDQEVAQDAKQAMRDAVAQKKKR